VSQAETQCKRTGGLGAEPAAAAHMANVRQPTEYPQPRAGRRFRFVDRDNGLGRPFGASESLAWPRGPRSEYARPERCEVQADHASPKDRFGAEGRSRTAAGPHSTARFRTSLYGDLDHARDAVARVHRRSAAAAGLGRADHDAISADRGA